MKTNMLTAVDCPAEEQWGTGQYECGDILNDKIREVARPVRTPIDFDEWHVIPVEMWSLRNYHSCWMAGIDIVSLHTESQCPVTQLKYEEFLPMYILTKDAERYRDTLPEHVRQMTMDKSWMANHAPDLGPNPKEDMSDFERMLFGTGYTFGTGPYDGNPEARWFTVELSNGDLILGAGWVWYNK